MKFEKLAAKYITGLISEVKLSGPAKNVAVINDMLTISKSLYEELNCQKPDLSTVMSLLEQKSIIARRFEQITGIEWKF